MWVEALGVAVALSQNFQAPPDAGGGFVRIPKKYGGRRLEMPRRHFIYSKFQAKDYKNSTDWSDFFKLACPLHPTEQQRGREKITNINSGGEFCGVF